jgi:hypothetical protein
MTNEKLVSAISLLLARTESNKIKWESDSWIDGYSIVFDENKVSVRYNGKYHVFAIHDEDGNIIEEIADPEINKEFQSSQNLIAKIFELARRNSLGLDDILDNIIGKLK